MPYDAFDRLPRTDLEVPGGTIHVAFAPGDITLPKEKLLDWIRMSARAVTTYYGRFPVASLRLLSMKQLGVGLAAAILLDATVVRALALPAAVALLGRHGPRVKPARLRGGQLAEARG